MGKVLVVGSNGTLANSYLNLYPNEDYILLDRVYEQDLQGQKDGNKFKFDITCKEHYIHLKEYLINSNMEVKGLIFFHGIQFSNSFLSLTEEEWQKTIDINVKASLFMIKHLYETFAAHCSIVLLSSQNGVVGHLDRIDYGTSKAALIHLVKNLSLEFARIKGKDIKINCISPGYIYSEKSREYLNSYKGHIIKHKIPYNSFVLPEDVAHTVQFLISDMSKAIRGQNIIIDYGYTIG